MADEQSEKEVVEESKQEVVETADEPVAEPEVKEDPHPLDPGGKRFADVYARMRESQREAEQLRADLAAERAARTVQPQPQQAPKEVWYTPNQLQELKDNGRITEAQMMDQLAWQRAEMKARDMQKQAETQQIASAALAEVDQYVQRVPQLANANSPELAKVARAAREIALEMGKSVADPLVQRRALRETYGTLDRLTSVRKVQDSANRNADTHTESTPGAGVLSQRRDPVKDAPAHLVEHWKRLGYTREQMLEEAKYIKPRRSR